MAPSDRNEIKLSRAISHGSGESVVITGDEPVRLQRTPPSSSLPSSSPPPPSYPSDPSTSAFSEKVTTSTLFLLLYDMLIEFV